MGEVDLSLFKERGYCPSPRGDNSKRVKIFYNLLLQYPREDLD
jgi:hypothetical protein